MKTLQPIETYRKCGSICVILCNETVRKIIDYLIEAKVPRNVGSIHIAIGVRQATVSNYLSTLKKYRIVKSHRIGKMIFYQLQYESLFKIHEGFEPFTR